MPGNARPAGVLEAMISSRAGSRVEIITLEGFVAKANSGRL
jgi:hypothetical protein